jgi:hypothetical protein
MEKEQILTNTDGIIKTLTDAEVLAQKRVCELVSCIYFYGGFKAETHNERELHKLLSKLGYVYKNEDELMAKLFKQ